MQLDVRQISKLLVYGPQVGGVVSEIAKSWPEVARERSLEVRRRGARGKPDEKKGKAVERLQIDGPDREVKKLLETLPTAHLEEVIGKSLKQVINTENNRQGTERFNALCDESKVARSSSAFYDPQMQAIVIGPKVKGLGEYKRVFYHEYGHAVVVAIELAYQHSPSKEVRERAGNIRSWIHHVYDDEGLYVSPYAYRSGNPTEAFCEAYSQYMQGGEHKSGLQERCRYTYELVDKLVKGEMKWW